MKFDERKNNTTYISVDIESDGPIPADNSMLSLGAAAFKQDGTLIATFFSNLKPLENATPNKDTMDWWASNPVAYKAATDNAKDPEVVMKEFVEWVDNLDGSPVFVGYPATFDFGFCYWYMMHFVGRSPFSFSALDIKTYACSMLKTDYRKTTKRNMPKRWFSEDKHTHISVDDAIEQGKLFINMLKENVK